MPCFSLCKVIGWGIHKVSSPKCSTSLKLDVITIQVLQTVEDSCKKCIKKENMQIFSILGWKCENFVICFDVQELF